MRRVNIDGDFTLDFQVCGPEGSLPTLGAITISLYVCLSVCVNLQGVAQHGEI